TLRSLPARRSSDLESEAGNFSCWPSVVEVEYRSPIVIHGRPLVLTNDLDVHPVPDVNTERREVGQPSVQVMITELHKRFSRAPRRRGLDIYGTILAENLRYYKWTRSCTQRFHFHPGFETIVVGIPLYLVWDVKIKVISFLVTGGHLLRSKRQRPVAGMSICIYVLRNVVKKVALRIEEPTVSRDAYTCSFYDRVVSNEFCLVITGFIISIRQCVLILVYPYAPVSVPRLLNKKAISIDFVDVVREYNRIRNVITRRLAE